MKLGLNQSARLTDGRREKVFRQHLGAENPPTPIGAYRTICHSID